MRQAVRVAKKVGKGLGRSEILQRQMSEEQKEIMNRADNKAQYNITEKSFIIKFIKTKKD